MIMVSLNFEHLYMPKAHGLSPAHKPLHVLLLYLTYHQTYVT